MVKTAVKTLTVALVFLIQVHAHAEETGTQVASEAAPPADIITPDTAIVEGDKLELYFDRKLKSIGNAAIHKADQNIYGDLIEYDVQNENVHVLGNAKLELNDSEINGPELNMKIGETIGEMKNPKFTLKKQFSNILQLGKSRNTTVDANTTTVTDARTGVSQQQYDDDSMDDGLGVGQRAGVSRGDASVVFFEGENKKRLKDARYTTCSADSDDWYLKASELEIDGYTKTVVAHHATVEFQGVPILYTPWMNFSFANQRQSGFLAPTWGSTSLSGFQIVTPYYWNIAPNMDATFGPRYLSKRGVQFVSEFRYLGETYSGIDNIEYLPSDSTTGATRYYAKLQHQQTFGGGLSGGYNLEKTSDDKYFSENLYFSRLSTGISSTSRVILPQNAYLNYRFGDNWNLNGLVSKYQTLDNLSFPYERLPQLTLTNNQDFGPATFNLVSQWVQFDRDQRAPIAVTGSRFVANPSVSTTFARPYGYITPKVGVHYTDYKLNDASVAQNGVANYDSTNRTLPTFSLDSGLFFDRDTRIVNTRYTQTLEPRLFYVYIPYKDQSNLPIFDTSEATLSYGSLFLENQFTGYDRVNDANQVTMALTTRMIESRTGEQRLAASIGQRFYFSDQRVTLPGRVPSGDNTSDYFAAITARLKTHWNVDLAGQYSSDRRKLVRSNISARYNPEPGKAFNFGYRYAESRFATTGIANLCTIDPRYSCGLDQLNVSAQWPLGRGFYGLGRWNYSLEESKPIEALAGLEYDAGCWQARGVLQRIATPTADANYGIFFQLELGGLASIGQNPLRLLTRGIPGYQPSGSIPESYQGPTDE